MAQHLRCAVGTRRRAPHEAWRSPTAWAVSPALPWASCGLLERIRARHWGSAQACGLSEQPGAGRPSLLMTQCPAGAGWRTAGPRAPRPEGWGRGRRGHGQYTRRSVNFTVSCRVFHVRASARPLHALLLTNFGPGSTAARGRVALTKRGSLHARSSPLPRRPILHPLTTCSVGEPLRPYSFRVPCSARHVC